MVAHRTGVQRDYAPAQKAIVDLHRAGGLNQEALARFAQDRKVEETVAALAAISGLTIPAVEQVVCGSKRDSILILGRALGLEWATVRALVPLRLAAGRMPARRTWKKRGSASSVLRCRLRNGC